ncbi:MAG: fibronectin type III domain-containing protein, partial [archaeon]|nr:fibronectin type III domain-containing protein [archaeon]
VSPTQTKNVYYDVTPPGKVNDLELDSVDDEAIDLEWDSGSDSGSGIKEYEVYRSTSSSIPDSSSRTTSGTSTSITGLDECTTYYFWVKAIDKAGNKGNASDRLEAKTSGCASSSNNNNTNNDSSNNSGGSLPACAVTFDVETPWYAGDSIVVEVESSQSYTGGELSSFATGKLTQNHGKTNLSQRAWGATIPIPLEIGNTFTLKFTADQCSAAVKTGIILDPAARTAAPVSEPAPPVESVSHEEVLMSIDSGMLPLILQEAGFNPEDQDTLAETTQLMDEWNVSKFIQIIPSPTETGKYVLKIIYRLESNGHSTIRLIENVPKAMANFTSELTSEHGFTTLKDDPIIQFEALDLREGEAVEFSYQTIASFTQEEAEFLAAQLSARTSPPILQGELNDDQPSLFSGLVSAASGMAMPIIGILVIAGIILMGRRMIPTDTRGMDNPILWSSARSDRMHGKPIVPSRFEPTPFRTVKWKR